MRNRYVLLADIAGVALCVLGAFVLRLDWFFQRSPEYTAAFHFALGACLLAKPVVFFLFGLYSRFWRYAGIRDLLVVFLAVSASSMALALVIAIGVMFGAVPFFPRSILAIDWLLTLACIAGIRLSIRVLSETLRASHGPETGVATTLRRVLVVGAGDAGALVVREMRKNPQLAKRPVGFLDDQPSKLGKRIYDVPVLAPLSGLEAVVSEHLIDEVVIAMPTAPGSTVRAVIDACQRAGITARSVPGMFELLEGGVSVTRLRDVEIADLLRRAQVEVRPEAGLYLQGRVVLVTGAGGSIGSELSRQVARAQASALVLLGHGENSIFDAANRLRDLYPSMTVHPVIADVRDAQRVEAVLRQYRPSVVFHAAAHKHVPLMEAHPEEAVTNNIVGTSVLVDAAIAAGVERFVLVSTDKAVSPTSVMGASKRMAELIVRHAARAHRRAYLAVRFGNVLGSRGSVVPFFKHQIERGGPVTITHPEMTRYFMTIPEAVYLVVKAGGLANGGELFVLNMGEPVRIVDLAHDLIRLSGFAAGNVPVVYSGLRPGEKVHEQLWEADSFIEPASSTDVFRVVEPGSEIDDVSLRAAIRELQDAASRGDVLTIHRILSECLPTFVSSLHGEGAPARSRR